jgi:ParB/RepB/Spo0J family partition protein
MNHKFEPLLENIPLELIDPGDRYREDYKDIDSLIDSIKESGLIHPIAVKALDNDTYLLLAGGRRLAAFHKMSADTTGVSSIPCRIFPSNLSELDYRVIELIENIQREDLNYAEEAALTAEVLRLQQARYGQRVSTSPDAPGYSMADAAKLLGKSKTLVSDEVALADAIEAIPELGQMKNKTEALKALGRIKEGILQQELAKRVQSGTLSTDADRKKLVDSYIINAFEEGANGIPDGSVDLFEMDPPYNIELRHVVETTPDQMKALLGQKSAMTEADYAMQLITWFRLAYKKLKPNGWLIVWYAMDPWHTVTVEAMRVSGFEVSSVHGTWSKNNGNTRTPNIHLANAYEPFLYGRKGVPVLNRQGRLNEFRYNIIGDKSHPTEKPIDMYADLFSTFCFPSSLIISAFLGSGNAILGANNCGLRCIGFEQSEEYKDRFILKVYNGVLGQYTSY